MNAATHAQPRANQGQIRSGASSSHSVAPMATRAWMAALIFSSWIGKAHLDSVGFAPHRMLLVGF
jgi:hypothetical protein